MKPELKKLLVLNLPYLLFVYLFAKCGQAYRLAAGADASAKLLNLTGDLTTKIAEKHQVASKSATRRDIKDSHSAIRLVHLNLLKLNRAAHYKRQEIKILCR